MQRPVNLRSLILTTVAFLLLSLYACVDNYFDLSRLTDPQLEPSIAMPLINAELSFNQLFNDTAQIIREDPETGLISLVFESRGALSQMADSIMHIPDQNLSYNDVIAYRPTPQGVPFEHEYHLAQGFTPEMESQRFDTIYFKSGTKTIRYTTTIDHPSLIHISSPSLLHKETHQPFYSVTECNNPGQGLFVFETETDLSDYYMVFTHKEGMPNHFSFDCLLEIYGDEHARPKNYVFDTEVFLEHILFQKIIGYFAQYHFNVSDTLYLDIFDRFPDGLFQLHEESVDLDIIITNSIGMPILIHFSPFEAISAHHPPYEIPISLFGPGNPNEFLIHAPEIEQLGSSVVTQPDINANLAEAINMNPQYIYFEGSGVSNPDMNPKVTNFLLDTSSFNVDLITTLKLHGKLEHFVLQDTLAFDMEFPDAVISVDLFVSTTNGFPVELALQAYFLDENYHVLDSLMTASPAVIQAAEVGPPPEGRVSRPAESNMVISLTEDQFESMSRAVYMLLRAELSTASTDYVRIYNDGLLKVNMSATLNTRISP